MNLVFFGVKKSGISVFLVSAENGAGVNKMTDIAYGLHYMATSCPKALILFLPFNTISVIRFQYYNII